MSARRPDRSFARGPTVGIGTIRTGAVSPRAVSARAVCSGAVRIDARTEKEAEQ